MVPPILPLETIDPDKLREVSVDVLEAYRIAELYVDDDIEMRNVYNLLHKHREFLLLLSLLLPKNSNMATHDVPGSNPANKDVLTAGCWCEHDDGSLIFVKGTEGGQVVYEIFDLSQDPPVSYSDAMRESAFKTTFSWKPGDADVLGGKWLWHDKTPFPWDRVMKNFDRPAPQVTSAEAILSAAARVAESLRLRAQTLDQASVGAQQETKERKGRAVIDRLAKAFDAFME